MSMKSVWLLALMALALAFAGFASPAGALSRIDDIKIEAHDADNDPDNQYGIRLVRVTVEGDLDDNTRESLGTVQLYLDEAGDGNTAGDPMVQVVTGSLESGGHELAATSGTSINGTDDRIETNNDGEFTFVFFLPADVVPSPASDVTLILAFGNEDGDLDFPIYDAALLAGDIGKRGLGSR